MPSKPWRRSSITRDWSRSGRRKHQPHDVLVTIQDTGIGVVPELLGGLFNPFYTTKPHGMGLGLSICRSIVEAHGGQIWGVPQCRPGMTFKFAIPAPAQSGRRVARSR